MILKYSLWSGRHWFYVSLIIYFVVPQLLHHTVAQDSETHTTLGQPVNIVIVFDASGSMAATIGGERKIDAARRAMEFVIANLPSDLPNLNVGFRIYGHEGDNTEAQRPLSCQSTSLLVPVLGVNEAVLRQQTYAWEPTGWTPIALALREASLDLEEVSEYQSCQGQIDARNVIIIVTDGEETCDGNPCEIAQAIASQNTEMVLHVVGFGLTSDVASTLQCIPQNDGEYIDARDGDSLATILVNLIGLELEAQGLSFEALEIEQFEYTPLEITELELTPISVGRIEVTPGGVRDGTFVAPVIEIPTVQPLNIQPPQISQPTTEAGDVSDANITPGSVDANLVTQVPATATPICPLPQR